MFLYETADYAALDVMIRRYILPQEGVRIYSIVPNLVLRISILFYDDDVVTMHEYNHGYATSLLAIAFCTCKDQYLYHRPP